jgi:hypothetical protein
MKTRVFTGVAVVIVCVFGLTACSTQARAERKGKAAGDEICALKDSSNANEAQRHLNSANRKLDDLAPFTGRDVREDIRDLNRNLQQMSRGNATAQDVNAIVRSVEDARHSAHGNTLAAYDGMLEALANCD